MVKLHFSIRAAIVAFLIDLVGGVLSTVWSMEHPRSLGSYLEVVFLAPYAGIGILLEHFRIFFPFQSFTFMVLVSGVAWACVAGFVWPLFRRRGTRTI